MFTNTKGDCKRNKIVKINVILKIYNLNFDKLIFYYVDQYH